MILRVSLVALALFMAVATSFAQEEERPSVPWKYGGHLGLNFNMTGVGYGQWLWPEDQGMRPGGSFIPEVLNDGSGIGLYIGANAQYHFFDWLALQGRLSYDMRSVTATDDQSLTKPDGTFYADEYDFRISLINFEALMKLYVGDQFHFTGGGGMGFKIDSYYTYKLDGQDPESKQKDIAGSSIVGSFVAGFGIDIPMSDASDDQQWFITPFAEASYMVGMKEVDFDTQSGFADGLTIPTVRIGLAVSVGTAEREDKPAPVGKFFRISTPDDGIYTTRVSNEYFPLRPFVFFDKGSTVIPADGDDGTPRYEVITLAGRDDWIDMASHTVMDAEHATDADENRYMQGRVYYNILNIVGYRLQKNPSATITLIGSDPTEKNGDELANSVKQYLVDVWEIADNRIEAKGQVNPNKPSGTARTPAADRPLTVIENRRVEITSEDPAIMKRAMVRAERPAREENEIYIQLTTDENIVSWQVTISGEGQSKKFGPFSSQDAYMDPTGLLVGGADEGDFTAEVIAKTADGRTLSETESFELRLNENDALGTRFQLNFDYSQEDPVTLSENFLTGIAPQIPDGATVIISGFTDNIGVDDFNKKLSQERADQAKDILERKLNELGISATVRAIGYGEDSDRHPYPNGRPEGRMYNRSVIVDIIP